MSGTQSEIKKILLVEDNEKDVELTLEALGEQHNLANEVMVVRDGQEALDFLFREGEYASRPNGNPVVILLDLKMPKIDGIETLKRIKKDPRTQAIPVVMLTSSAQEKDIVESYKLGVNAYVVKPVEFALFDRAIRELGLFWAVINAPPPGS